MADAPKPAAPAAVPAAADAPVVGGAAASAVANGAAAPAAPAVAAPANGGEPPFKMKLEPSDLIIFKTDKYPPEDGAVIDVKITNTTKQLQCYKVKTTSNDIFRVRPPFGYVKQDETFTVKFSLIAKAMPNLAKHFFAFYHVGVEDDAKTARQLWTPTTKPDGVTRVPVKLLKTDGTPRTSAEATTPPPDAGAPAPAAPTPDDGTPTPATVDVMALVPTHHVVPPKQSFAKEVAAWLARHEQETPNFSATNSVELYERFRQEGHVGNRKSFLNRLGEYRKKLLQLPEGGGQQPGDQRDEGTQQAGGRQEPGDQRPANPTFIINILNMNIQDN